jgi:hypothetical protein
MSFLVQSSHRWSPTAILWASIICVLGCGSSQAASGVKARGEPPQSGAAPPEQPGDSSSTQASPSAAPASAVATSSSRDTTLEEAVALVARPALWPLDMDPARDLLQKFGPVTNEQPAPSELSLESGPSGALRRAEVSYTLDEQRHWHFDSAGFFFGNADLKQLHDQLQALLIQQLGKPEWTENDAAGEVSSSGWALREPPKLLFSPSPNGGEPYLMIAISEPQGEEE